MTRRYFRKAAGRFRRATLADFGMSCCEKCGAIFTPALPPSTGLVDPRDFRKAQQFCAACGGSPESESSGLVADLPDPPPPPLDPRD
jgi:hypothetical protein